jgi:hypothetical protein
MFVEMCLFNDTKCPNQFITWRQVKTEWGVSRRDGEREREEQIRRVREGV